MARLVTGPIRAKEIRAELSRRVDVEYREGCRRFFKETVDPWGVRSADLKEIEAATYRGLKQLDREVRYRLFEELWRSGKLEEGAMVCHLGRRFKREFGVEDFRRFERWMDEYVANWSHCDSISTWLLAGCIENDPALRSKVIAWTRSKNRWKRRSAAVSFLQEGKKGRSVDFIFDICKRLEQDSDPMVQKGVGWVLKETCPKRPDDVIEFLRLNNFPRLVVRYAAEKMSIAARATIRD
jgi:3-methyladenine DNA glycosylase AlkD